jgi:iron complex outermembrane receptor protein
MKHNPLSLACAMFAAGIATNAFAQQAPGDAPKDSTSMDTIIVTGTHMQNRTVAESLSPIDIVTPEMLKSTGASNLATALSRVVPSINFPSPALTDGTDAVRPAQMRGLGPDQVLVLVNGKRWHSGAIVNVNGTEGRGSNPVDLNTIPMDAIERVEVLRDGASAQYGSDAIAGVINIVLKGGSEHGDLDMQLGQYSAGDGFGWIGGGDIGFKLGDAGWVRFAAQADSSNQTNRATPYDPLPGTNTNGQAIGVVSQRFGEPQIDEGKFSLNSEYKLSDSATLYAFADVSNRNSTSNGFYRQPLASNNIYAIYPNGYVPLELFHPQDRQVVGGVKGAVFDGWHYDLSASYGWNSTTIDVAHSLNTSLGIGSPTYFYDGALENKQGALNLDINKDVNFSFLPNAVTVAFGGQYLHDEYEVSAGDPASYFGTGAQVYPGYQPGDAGDNSRHSYAAYLDLESNLTDKLSAGLAGRYENYSDFGGALTGKASLRYQFTDAIAVRATASNGFRAPSLAQEFYSSTSIQNLAGVGLTEIRTFPVSSPVAEALGAEPLKAEKSRNYSAGLVLQPTENLSATLDAYQITIDHRIILSGNLTGAAVQEFLAEQGYDGVQGGRYFTNAVNTRTRGVDAVATYKLDLDNAGTLNLNVAGNYNQTSILYIQPNPPILAANGFTFPRITRDEIGRLTEATPRTKYMVGADWNIWKATFHADMTRYGSVTSLSASSPIYDQTFGAKWLLNVAATYHLNNLDLTIGSDNVTNQYPDKAIFANTTNGQLMYSEYSPFGFEGAFVYVKAALHW